MIKKINIDEILKIQLLITKNRLIYFCIYTTHKNNPIFYFQIKTIQMHKKKANTN